jgi:hypothetical protein
LAGLSKILISCVALFVLYGCSSTGNVNSKKVFKTGVNLLYGEISRDDLFTEFPSWKDKYDAYEPDSNVVNLISAIRKDISVEVFLGTWCGDSRREVPRFLKIADQTKFVDPTEIQMWAVDKNKNLDSDITVKKNIEYVATFIFISKGEEKGRIVERPKSESLEKDILAIVEGIR